MYSNYLHNKRNEAIFLNVKPILSVKNNGGVRKYSNSLIDRLDSGFNAGDISGTSRDSVATITSLAQKFHPNVLYSTICPVQWFLRAIAVLPLTRRGPGQSICRFGSTAFMYCLVFFSLLTLYVVFVAKNRIIIVMALSGPFEEAVIAYIFLVNILPILIIPIAWWETRKVAKLMNDWDDFELLYYQISGHSLPMTMRRKTIIIAILLPVFSVISVVITHLTMSDFQLSQIIPYCILDNLTAMLGAWWFLLCDFISNTAHIVVNRFQMALKHVGPAAMVADYRALWLRLSKLTRDTGNSICYSFTFLALYLFFIITLSIYGLMSQLSEGFGIKDIGLAITALWNICLLFFVCDEAHYASHNVRANFQKRLLMVELNWMNADAQTEINMFLRATELNPSNINCGGFFDVNRNLFKGLLTTMVTYLVVLLQFQISMPNDSKDASYNMTLVDILTNIFMDKTTMQTTTSPAVIETSTMQLSKTV